MKLWVSSSKFTCQVNTDDSGTIVWTAPFLAKFKGQKIAAIERWCQAKRWPLTIEVLT